MLVVGGKPLSRLSGLDIAFICFNKATSPLFVYHVAVYLWYYTGDNVRPPPSSK